MGIRFPDKLADEDTKGLPKASINLMQKLLLGTLKAIELLLPKT